MCEMGDKNTCFIVLVGLNGILGVNYQASSEASELICFTKSAFDVCEYFINCLSSSFAYHLPGFPGGLSQSG